MKRLLHCMAGLAVMVAVSLSEAAATAAIVQYAVTDLGTLGGAWSHPLAVNNTGQVVGLSSTGTETHAFLWSGGLIQDLRGLTSDHRYSRAWGINDAGQVVGTSAVEDNPEGWPTQRPFIYTGGTMTSLGSFGGGYGFANGINNAGQVVGLSRYSNGVTHAFLWSGNTMTDVGSFGEADYSCAYGINDRADIVGVYAAPATGPDRGFIWQNGVTTDLGDLAGGLGHTRAYRVNNLGQVVGESWLNDPATAHGFVWENGVMTDLGPMPGTTGGASQALGINNRGEVVGAASGRAFIWDSVNGMRDLNSMLDPSGADWLLFGCRDINDAGQIVGWGYYQGSEEHAVLLTPIPEPSTLIVWSVLGALYISFAAWRRKAAGVIRTQNRVSVG